MLRCPHALLSTYSAGTFIILGRNHLSLTGLVKIFESHSKTWGNRRLTAAPKARPIPAIPSKDPSDSQAPQAMVHTSPANSISRQHLSKQLYDLPPSAAAVMGECKRCRLQREREKVPIFPIRRGLKVARGCMVLRPFRTTTSRRHRLTAFESLLQAGCFQEIMHAVLTLKRDYVWESGVAVGNC